MSALPHPKQSPSSHREIKACCLSSTFHAGLIVARAGTANKAVKCECALPCSTRDVSSKVCRAHAKPVTRPCAIRYVESSDYINVPGPPATANSPKADGCQTRHGGHVGYPHFGEA